MKPERRCSGGTIELRENDGGAVIAGVGAVFYDGTARTEFSPWDGLVERIDAKAFDRALADGDDVRGLFNHEPDNILGRVAAGTMRLAKQSDGLAYEIDVPDSPIGKTVREAIRRGDVSGSSFSFIVTDQEFSKEDGTDVRTITGVELWDVGPVTFPAYEATSAGLRTRDGVCGYEEWIAEQERAAAHFTESVKHEARVRDHRLELLRS